MRIYEPTIALLLLWFISQRPTTAEDKNPELVRRTCLKIEADKSTYDTKRYYGFLDPDQPYCYFAPVKSFHGPNRNSGGNKYKFDIEQARALCNSHYGATLPVIRNRVQKEHLFNQIRLTGPGFVDFGSRHVALDVCSVPGPCRWIDNTKVEFQRIFPTSVKQRTQCLTNVDGSQPFQYMTLEENAGHFLGGSSINWKPHHKGDEMKHGVLVMCMLQYPMPEVLCEGVNDLKPCLISISVLIFTKAVLGM